MLSALSEELVASGELLSDHTGDRNHREASVVDLLGGHLLVLDSIRGLESDRVEAEIARLVVGADGPRLAAEGGVEGEDGADRSRSQGQA